MTRAPAAVSRGRLAGQVGPQLRLHGPGDGGPGTGTASQGTTGTGAPGQGLPTLP